MTYQLIHDEGSVPIKAWTQGVPLEDKARQQLRATAQLPFIHKWVAVMPDVHLGMGATIGSVIPTLGAVIPAAVGVDIGCGMMAVRTSLRADQLPDSLARLRGSIERAVPHGRTSGRRGRYSVRRDRGSWGNIPDAQLQVWGGQLAERFDVVCEKLPAIKQSNSLKQLGTLGSGNHFIEVCLDEADAVWIMLHSGSRGVGNRIGSQYIELAREDMEDQLGSLPGRDLAYFEEGSPHFANYVEAVGWAQDFARISRELMMAATVEALRSVLREGGAGDGDLASFRADIEAVNCHHNYVSREHHYGEDVLVTRKGAVRAGLGELGIIPGSMGAKSFIVRGKGNPESFCSCSHGAGRAMSRTAAKKRFSVQDQIEQTAGVECRKDAGVIDEIPAAYKSIEDVMAAQADLVEVLHTLKQVLCVKG